MSWIMGIVGVIVLSVLIDIVLPEGQMNKYIKGIFAILLIYMLISPVVALAKKDFDITSLLQFDTSGYEENSAYIQSINTDRLNRTKTQITSDLQANGIITVDIVIFCRENNINLVDYVLVELPYGADNSRETQIKTIVRRYLGVAEDNIRIIAYS